jgi:hypothetical protein
MRGFLHRIARLERLATAAAECVVRIRHFDATSGALILERVITLPAGAAQPVARPGLATDA